MKRLIFLLTTLAARAAELPADQVTFFENNIRPVLASACYDCHGAVRQKSGLRVDWREGLLKGGQRGPALVPGDPDKSLLIQAIAHSHPELKMPKDAAALNAATVDKFREWVRMGAPDPRDKAPDAEASQASDWPAVFALRKQWWCFQPLKAEEPPEQQGVSHPVDRFLRASMQEAGLAPSPVADPATRVRRASFILTGLPPDEGDVAAFTKDPSPAAWSALIDRLLASPRFGERWARHWMDWLRYAESHGSEGDPAIRYAWRYRDYLIRALNADVPWPQLVREHIAGDRLPKPRINEALGLNESAIGPAHLRMVFHGFTPTDALDEFVTFTDNQVDVVSKAFMGLTVSCARCHNHKFDAISQEDYYALYGIFASCRPAVVNAAAPLNEAGEENLRRLSEARAEIGARAGQEWYNTWADRPDRAKLMEKLTNWKPADEAMRREADGEGTGPLAAWLRLKDLPPQQMRDGWNDLAAKWAELKAKRAAFLKQPSRAMWRAAGDTSLKMFTSGPGLDFVRNGTGGFSVAANSDRLIGRVRPDGSYSDACSDRQPGIMQSSRFKSEGGRLWVRAAGRNAVVRYVVQNYPRSGLIYPKRELSQDFPGWISWNLDYWKGETLYLELTTIPDAPIEGNDADRAWFGLTDVIYPADDKSEPPRAGTSLLAFCTARTEPPSTKEQLAERYAHALELLSIFWYGGAQAPDFETAEFLDFMLRAGFLSGGTEAGDGPGSKYRKLEADLPKPVRVPGVMEGDAFDQPLYVRGDHKKPGAPVPRHFLEAIDGKPYAAKDSGRLQLAESLVNPSNPLPSRVMVNRLWHHVFGRGIVATTDNFGKLGEARTHPELLDWLALRFQKEGGSIKSMLRLMLTSEAFQASAQASPAALEKDPENKLLSHFTLRRLEAEAIRDAILTVSGKLDLTAFGPPVDGGAPRRSVYVKVIRNALDPFLTAFDAPVPSSTRGRRDSTNVPAQALALMNSPVIQSWANDWSDRVSRTSSDPAERVRQFYRSGFGREPGEPELDQCFAYVHDVTAQSNAALTQANEWRQRLSHAENERDSILTPVQRRLFAERNAHRALPGNAPAPIAEWDFESSARDLRGALHLKLHGNARVEGGALVVDGKDSYASTPALTKQLRTKTLEAWVQLGTLEQAGGGVLSIQGTDGEVFDAIVFAEQNIGQWLPGSNYFQRSQGSGSQDREAASRPVHIAITYAEDGTIAVWRDGKRYGQPYKSNGPATYEAGQSNILLGLRHGEPTGNRLLNARILRARLYDRALTENEIAVSSQLEGVPVPPEDILAALSSSERLRYEAACSAAEKASRQLESLTPSSPSPQDAWRSLALAMINMKEFIYLR
jgi:hypothetical protein